MIEYFETRIFPRCKNLVGECRRLRDGFASGMVFGDLLDEMAVLHICGKDTEVLENFIVFGSIMQNNGMAFQHVSSQIGRAHAVMDSLGISIYDVSACALE